MTRLTVAMCVMVLLAPLAHAGLYTPDDPCPFQMNADGTAKPLPHVQFISLLADRFSGWVPRDTKNPGTFDWFNEPLDESTVLRASYAGQLSQWVATRWPQASQLRGAELAGLTTALIRLQAYAQAMELLQPELRSRSPNYWALANLVHLHAERGEWDAAVSRFTNLADCDDPGPLAGTSPQQWQWLKSLDEQYYRLWLKTRKHDAESRGSIEEQKPDPLFANDKGLSLQFWHDAAARKQLPSDAVAIVQQLCLWAPWDAKLLWLLAEVYTASGQLREADATFNMLTEARKYSGPALFKERRRIVNDAVGLLPKTETVELQNPSSPPTSANKGLFGVVDPEVFWPVAAIFAIVALLLMLMQFKSVRRKLIALGNTKM